MSSSQIIVWMIICCIVFVILLFFSKPVKLLLRVIIGGIVGGLSIFLTNFILAPFGISVGINFVTMLVVGILGIPGFITLYIASWIL